MTSVMQFQLTTTKLDNFNIVADAQGPAVQQTTDGFTVQRGTATADNQWTRISNATNIPVGSYLSFDVKFSTIQPATEMKLTLPAKLILHYNSGAFNYTYSNNGFILIGASNITVDQAYHHIQLNMTATGVQIIEDGQAIGLFSTTIPADNHVQCDFQILARASQLSAQVKNLRVGLTE